jgi:MFS family permease
MMILSAPLLASANTILLFLVGLTILHIGNNILTPAYQSLVPDRVPKEQRGEASGYVGAMTILGNIASLGLAAWLLGQINQRAYHPEMIRNDAGVYYIVTAIALLIDLLITLIAVHEVPFLPSHQRGREVGESIKPRFTHWFVQNWVDPWHNYNFTLVFLTRSLIMLGLAMFMTFIEYYFARVQHITNFVQVRR